MCHQKQLFDDDNKRTTQKNASLPPWKVKLSLNTLSLKISFMATAVGPTLSSPWRAPDRNTYGSSAQPTPMSGGEDGRGRGRR